MKTLSIYAVGWSGMVVLAILNGLLREKTYGRRIRELHAHQLSSVTGLIVFGAYIWWFTGVIPIASMVQGMHIGGMWLAMTIAFEFVFGHYAMGHSWRRLLQDYNLRAGRIWALVLVWTAVAPCLFHWLRR